MSRDIKRDTFIETDSKYGSGMCLDDYNDMISICNAHPDGDKVWLEWCFAQDKDRKPREKGLPWKINIGRVSDAIHNLRSMADSLEHIYNSPGAMAEQKGTTSPASKKTGLPGGKLTNNPTNSAKDDVPF